MEALYIILGWLLGLLSPAIVKKISERKEKSNLEKIVFNDLRELKKRLVPLSFRVYPKYGRLDKKTFDWLKVNSEIDFSEGLEQLREMGQTDEQMLAYLNSQGLRENSHSYFKKMHLFATDSHLMNFGLIESKTMADILEIRFHIEAFNEDVESFREHLKMTFLPGITPENHRIVSQEIQNKSLTIANKSMFIVDKINEILTSREGSKRVKDGRIIINNLNQRP